MASPYFRLRVRFGKLQRLRFLSHLEVMRACERSIRRAGFDYAVTQGFSPKMRVAFGPALPVGTAGEREYLDVWLRTYVPAEEALRRLRAAAPPDLAAEEAAYVGEKESSLSATLTIACYEVTASGEGVSAESLGRALGAVVADGRLEVEQKGKTKVFDLATSLPKEPVVRSREGRVVVDVTTRMGPEGSLRPEVLVRQALGQADIDGAVDTVTRTDLLIDDEGVWRRPL